MAYSHSQSVDAGAVDETSISTGRGRSIMTSTSITSSTGTGTGHAAANVNVAVNGIGAGAAVATRTTKSSRASCRAWRVSRTIGFVVIAMVVSYTMVCQFQQMPHYLQQQQQTLQKLLNQDDHDLFHDFNGTKNNMTKTNMTKNITTGMVPVIDYNYTFLKYDDNNLHTKFPVPDWLDEFLQSQPTASHHDTLTSPHNKFLVMTCHKYANNIVEACGGIADRFKLLPYNLWLAHQTGRKLLIKYSKPSPLEDYLVPVPPRLQPKSTPAAAGASSSYYDKRGNNFDWRLPDGYLTEEWDAYANRTIDEMKLGRWQVYTPEILLANPKWATQKVIFINNNLAMVRTIPKQNAVYHDFNNSTSTTAAINININTTILDDAGVSRAWPGIFRRIFQPSPGVAKEIKAAMTTSEVVLPVLTSLQAGKFVAAHVRARYRVGVRGVATSKFAPMKFRQGEPRGASLTSNIDKLGGGGMDLEDAYTRDIVAQLSDNAVACALRLKINWSTDASASIETETDIMKVVYIASDSNEVVDYLQRESPLFAANKNRSFVNTAQKITPSISWSGAPADTHGKNNNTNTINGKDNNVHGFGVPSWEISASLTNGIQVLARPNHHNIEQSSIHFDSEIEILPLEDNNKNGSGIGKGGGVEDVYPTFVDLWIMAHATCHSFGVGGFGLFASKLSGHYGHCTTQHRDTNDVYKSCPTIVQKQQWEPDHE
jgi:hypothetical protein